ncbi:MAG: ABC transporter permease subunit [Clostridium sp.]
MSLKSVLYDNLGREYKRKNLYLYDVAKLEEEIKEEGKGKKEGLKEKLKDLKKNKQSHPYIQKLNEFKKEEKIFKEELKKSQTESKSEVKLIFKLEKRLEEAKKKYKFYKKYVNLTYDAELIYEQSKLEMEQIPAVLEEAKKSKIELDFAIKKDKEISENDEKKFKVTFENFKTEEKGLRDREVKELKEKYKNGIISKKAEEQGIKNAKKSYEDKVLMKSFESKKKYNNEFIKNKKYELSKGLKEKIRSIDININDLRRNYPIEVENSRAFKSYFTILTPGVGQLLNKQYTKASITLLGIVYTYLIAIPYALGYGNYKGDGIAGLITLAEGGKRLDRSIIFMIEGIIAIALLSIAFGIIVLAFKDALKVEKEIIKGCRPNSWCETKQVLSEDGVPYIISTPALIVTIFIVLVPIATTILLSFTGMDPNHQARFGWEGLSNYMILITGEGMIGTIFWKIFRWTIIWTIGATTLGIFLGFSLALLLNNERIKGKIFFRSIYLLPWAVPAFITIIFFSILSSPNGAITEMVQNLFGTTVSIKNDPTIAKIMLICIQGWLGSSYVFLLSTGVLQSINKDLYEAADIDGASTFRKLMKITIPMVLFQTAPLLVGQYTFNFNNFSSIYLFNGGGPFNPAEYGNLAGETDILISYIYKLIMENQEQAIGAAVSILISIGLMIVAYIGFSRTKAFKKES